MAAGCVEGWGLPVHHAGPRRTRAVRAVSRVGAACKGAPCPQPQRIATPPQKKLRPRPHRGRNYPISGPNSSEPGVRPLTIGSWQAQRFVASVLYHGAGQKSRLSGFLAIFARIVPILLCPVAQSVTDISNGQGNQSARAGRGVCPALARPPSGLVAWCGNCGGLAAILGAVGPQPPSC